MKAIRWFLRSSTVPDREQVVTALRNLPELPEASLMRHGPMQQPRPKPKGISEWRALYDGWPRRRRA